MKIKKFIDLAMLDRIDQLIRLKATGSQEEFASLLGIPLSTLKENIYFMKNVLKAPIRYNMYLPSYEYEYLPDFCLSFDEDRSKS